MHNPTVQSLTDSASYETLQKENPALLAAIEKCVAEGESAKSIERRIRRRYGDSMVALLVAGAAHYIEKQKQKGTEMNNFPFTKNVFPHAAFIKECRTFDDSLPVCGIFKDSNKFHVYAESIDGGSYSTVKDFDSLESAEAWINNET